MNDTISYKINKAYLLPYRNVINENFMDFADKNNEIIASSRIYLICSIKRKGLIFKSLSKPKVLYVGETFNKKKRFSTHKKLLKATSIISKKEELVIFFLHIRFSYVGLTIFENNPWNIFNEIKDINSRTSIRLVERFLIKLFRPVLNEKNNNKIMSKDELIREKLIAKNIEYVTLDIGMDDYIFNFTGGNRNEKIDWYTFELNTERMIYGHPMLNNNYC